MQYLSSVHESLKPLVYYTVMSIFGWHSTKDFEYLCALTVRVSIDYILRLKYRQRQSILCFIVFNSETQRIFESRIAWLLAWQHNGSLHSCTVPSLSVICKHIFTLFQVVWIFKSLTSGPRSIPEFTSMRIRILLLARPSIEDYPFNSKGE